MINAIQPRKLVRLDVRIQLHTSTLEMQHQTISNMFGTVKENVALFVPELTNIYPPIIKRGVKQRSKFVNKILMLVVRVGLILKLRVN